MIKQFKTQANSLPNNIHQSATSAPTALPGISVTATKKEKKTTLPAVIFEKNHSSEPLIFSLFFRTTILFVLFLSSLVLFYVIGNYQNFTDENLSLILSICVINALLLLFFAAGTIIVSIIYAIIGDYGKRRLRYIATIIFTTLFIAVGIVVVVFSDTLVFLGK